MLLIINAIISFWVVKFFIYLAKHYNWGKPVRQDGPESHLDKEGTPTMGGIAFLAVALITWLVFAPKSFDGWVLITLTSLAAFLGSIDDITSLKRKQRLKEGLVEEKDASTGLLARYRILLQGLIALVFAIYAVSTNHAIFGLIWLDVLAYTFIIVGSINAVNLTDGLDGLATGVVIILLLPFLAVPFSLCLLGSLLGFLWHNTKPAKVFMGGVGSEALGAAVAGIFILSDLIWWLPLMALIPLLEVLSVILQVSYFKLTGGKRILKMSPLHHHFELSGWLEEQVVVRFWLVTAFCVALAWYLRGMPL